MRRVSGALTSSLLAKDSEIFPPFTVTGPLPAWLWAIQGELGAPTSGPSG